MLLEIFVPILLIVGSLGNLVSVYVFTRPSVKGLSTFKFLAYLSVIDFLYLFIGLPHIMSLVYFDYDFRNYSNLICSLHSFLTIYLSHLSSNILAAVGVFRCVTITTLRPVKTTVTSAVGSGGGSGARGKEANASFRGEKNVRCPTASHSPPNNKETLTVVYSNSSHESILKRLFMPKCDHTDIIIGVIVFIVFLFDFHFLIFMRLTPVQYPLNANESTQFNCYPSANYSGVYFDFYTRIHPWIDMFLYSYIPFAIMIVSTAVIIHRLFVINKRLRKRSINHKDTMVRKNRLESTVNIHNEHEKMNELSSETKRVSKVSCGDTDDQMAEEQIKPKHNQLTIPSSVNSSHHSGEKKHLTVTSSLSGYEKPIVKVTQKKKNVSLARGVSRGVGTGGSGDLAKRRSKKNGQIYKLLLTLNIFFFILVTPLVLGNSVGFLNNQSTTTELVYILAYLNHCLNFLFYGFSCKIYRSILLDMLKNLLHFNLRLN